MIVGFSGFGFPKAHGAAFGLLAYQSTWLRVHYAPGVPVRAAQRAADGLLRARHAGPRGPAAGDRAARRPTSTRARSSARSSRRPARPGADRARLRARACARDEVAALVAARGEGGPFRSLADLASRAGAGRPALEKLAWAGACDALAVATGSTRARRAALWQLGVAAPGERVADGTQLALPLDAARRAALRALDPWEAMVADYATTGLTLGAAPARAAAPELPRAARSRARDLETLPHESRVRIGGLVVARQRPGTAKGIVVHPARGRVRDDQPDRAAAGLRAPPAHRPHRAARARRGQARAAADRRRGDQRLRRAPLRPLVAPERGRGRGRSSSPSAAAAAAAARGGGGRLPRRRAAPSRASRGVRRR